MKNPNRKNPLNSSIDTVTKYFLEVKYCLRIFHKLTNPWTMPRDQKKKKKKKRGKTRKHPQANAHFVKSWDTLQNGVRRIPFRHVTLFFLQYKLDTWYLILPPIALHVIIFHLYSNTLKQISMVFKLLFFINLILWESGQALGLSWFSLTCA